jgi:SAM-dependent methyltransferase
MGGVDTEALERAGLRVAVKAKVEYTDPELARDYLRWGFKPPEQVRAEARFAAERMGLRPKQSILDIGCGNGVSSIELSEMGFDVTALDISPVFLEAGRELAKERPRTDGAGAIRWVCADFFEHEYVPHDAAILLDPAIGVAERRFMDKLSQAVRPGGHFFLRYKGGGIANWPSSQWQYDAERTTFQLERHTLDRLTGTVHDEWLTLDLLNREVVIERTAHKLVLFSHFVEMMAAAGFPLVEPWGDVKGAPVTENSRIYALFVRGQG